MKKYTIVILLISIFTHIGITKSTDKPYKSLQRKYSRRGAIVGAVGGAAIGSGLFGGSSLKGAGFGAVAGAVGGSIGAISSDIYKPAGVVVATGAGATLGYSIQGNAGILPGATVGLFGGALGSVSANEKKLTLAKSKSINSKKKDK